MKTTCEVYLAGENSSLILIFFSQSVHSYFFGIPKKGIQLAVNPKQAGGDGIHPQAGSVQICPMGHPLLPWQRYC